MLALLRLTLFLACASTLLVAQTLELRSGRVLIGRVQTVDDTSVSIEVGYPEPSTETIALADLAPQSWYALLAQRTPAEDAPARISLAEASAKRGLRGHALAEYELAMRLDPARRSELAPKIAALRAELVRGLLTEAQAHLADGRWAEAKLTAQVVLERHPEAKTAAQAVLDRAMTQLKTAARTAKAEAAVVDRALKAVAKHEAQAAKLVWHEPPGSTVREAKHHERKAKELEAALAAVKELDDPRAEEARARLRAALSSEYLALALNFLARRALPDAEAWNAKACSLDPESGGCHRLQDLIIQARITSGVGG